MPPIDPTWKTALFTVRTQIADYEREGTSTPGKLKRAARLRAARMALRDLDGCHAPDVAVMKLALAQIESSEKDDQARRLALQIRDLMQVVDGLLAVAVHEPVVG